MNKHKQMKQTYIPHQALIHSAAPFRTHSYNIVIRPVYKSPSDIIW